MGACMIYACGDKRKPLDDTDYDLLLGANGWELEKMIEIEEQHEIRTANYIKEPRTISKVIPIPKKKYSDTYR